MARHIKKDDLVEVIAGDHKGQSGKVLRVLLDRNLAVIEGVNMVYRHVRPSRRNPQGGRLQKEAPIHMSNLLPVDPRSGKGSRVRFATDTDNHGRVLSKKRITVKGETTLGEVTRATNV